MSYLTAAEYAEITERPEEEATDTRIKRASMLLDARIGNYFFDRDTGRKLNMEKLPKHQQEAVKQWVAHMISFLFDHGDVAPSVTGGSISLGRFSVSQGTGTQPGQAAVPEQMNLTDAILVSSGIIRRGVEVR